MIRFFPGLVISLLFVACGVSSAYAAADDGDDDAPVKHATKRSSTKKAASHKVVRHVTYAHGRRHVVLQRASYAPIAPAIPSVGELEGLNRIHDALDLKSNVAFVLDQSSAEVLFDKNADVPLPIASITKLMTSLVVVEAHQDMNEVLEITDADVDREKFSSSRLRPGTRMTRGDMLHIALMSSENRAASALGRNYPGGLVAAVAAMNAKARELGMTGAHYVEPTGLSSQNVASARDLAKLVAAAQKEPLLCQYSTDSRFSVDANGREMQYANSNHLVSNPTWDIMLQKTGYITEAGHCLVMRAMIEGRSIVMVFLDSKGKDSRLGDASRIRKWLEAIKTSTSHIVAQQS